MSKPRKAKEASTRGIPGEGGSHPHTWWPDRGKPSLSGMESIPVLGEPGVRYWCSSGVRKATMWGKREVLEHGSDAKQEVSP